MALEAMSPSHPHAASPPLGVRGRLSRSAPIAALLLAACGSTAVLCEGEVQGTLTFRARPDDARTTCGWFHDQIIAGRASDQTFTATVSFLDATRAALCLQRISSQPKTGPRSGDTFTVSSAAPAAAGAVGTCPCGVTVEETFSATLLRGADGRVNGYRDGRLVGHLTRSADEASLGCYAAADAARTSGDCPGAAGCDVAYVAPPP